MLVESVGVANAFSNADCERTLRQFALITFAPAMWPGKSRVEDNSVIAYHIFNDFSADKKRDDTSCSMRLFILR